jgi:hypothetical protein
MEVFSGVQVDGRLPAAVLGQNPAGLDRESMRARWRVTSHSKSFWGNAGSPDFASGGGHLNRREKDRLREERRKRIRVDRGS